MRRPLDPWGTTGALLLVWLALSPSLLPRTWWTTALLVAVDAVFGYVLGGVAGAVWRALTGRRHGHRGRSRVAWCGALGVVTLVVWAASLRSQAQLARTVGVDPPGALGQGAGLLTGLALAVVTVLLGRLLRAAWHRLRRLTARRVPVSGVATAAAVLVLVAVTVVGADRLLLQTGLLERAAAAAATFRQPVTGLPAAGPGAAEIEAATGRPALQPVRVHVAVRADRDVATAADLLVARLEHAGGLDRGTVHLATPVGNGWVQEWSLQSVEYLTGGDVATAVLQYSHLPSAVAYLADRSTPAAAGRALHSAVAARLAQLPEEDRPRLVLSGESLGSFGSQAPFGSPAELAGALDGAVWSGTPRFTPLWAELTAGREAGSPETAPLVDGGRQVRFVTGPETVLHHPSGRPYGPWEEPRVAYVQHPSDPVVWWSPGLLVREPDWMRERAEPVVPSPRRWLPWVTFWQVTTDMPVALGMPPGHGHSYGPGLVPVWAGVLELDPAADWSAVQRAIAATVPER